MSPSSASNDDFPRLTGAENFDVWKMRIQAALDGKHLLGFIIKNNYDGVSDSDDVSSDKDELSEIEGSKSSGEAEEVRSDAVDYDEDSDDLRPDSEDEDGDKMMRASRLPAVNPSTSSRMYANARRRTSPSFECSPPLKSVVEKPTLRPSY